jgi:hypothetical protein
MIRLMESPRANLLGSPDLDRAAWVRAGELLNNAPEAAEQLLWAGGWRPGLRRRATLASILLELGPGTRTPRPRVLADRRRAGA